MNSYEAQQLFPGQVAEIERLNQQIMGGTTVALSVIHNDRYTAAFFLSHTHTKRGRREREREEGRGRMEREEGRREIERPFILIFFFLLFSLFFSITYSFPCS